MVLLSKILRVVPIPINLFCYSKSLNLLKFLFWGYIIILSI